MTPQFVRLPAVLEFTGLGRSAIYDSIATGTFPAPVRISSRAVAWRVSDLKAWAAGLESARAGAA